METRSVRSEFKGGNFRSLVHPSLSLARQHLTYCKHFGFAELPFSITSDPQFFYSNAANEKILAALTHEIAGKGAFVVITGEPGTGKTTLLLRLISDSADKVDYIFIGVNARLSFIGLLREILEEAGVASTSTDRESLLEQLDGYLQERRAKDREVALVFDEAQAISNEALKDLLLLCSTEGKALMSIVLAGQPGLQGRLSLLKSLKQRMTLTKRLTPLRKNDVAPYIALRLDKVGYQGEELFEPQAIERIADSSGGIPRLINALCDSALLRAYRAGEYGVTANMIDQVAYEWRLGGRLPSMDQRTPAEFLAPRVEAKEIVTHPGQEEEKEVQPPLALIDQSTRTEITQPRILEKTFLGSQVKAESRVVTDFEKEERESRLTEAAHRLKKFRRELVQFSDVNRAGLIGALMIVVASAWSFIMFYPQQRNVSGPGVAPLDMISPRKADPVHAPAGTRLIENKAAAKKPAQPAPVSILSLAVVEKSEKRNDLVAAKKPDESPSVNKAESRASEELYRVSGASFVRNKPTDNAEIIDTLKPGVRIAIINRSGEYFRVRSLGERSVSGFVHKEDAFFERIQ